MTLRDERGQDSGDALVGVDVCIPDVELSVQSRRAPDSPDQSAVADGQQRQRHEDAEDAIKPDVDAHHTAVVRRLQRTWTLDQDCQRHVSTQNRLDSYNSMYDMLLTRLLSD